MVPCRPDTVSQPKSESVLPVKVLTKGLRISLAVVAGVEDKVEGALVLAEDPMPTKLDSEKGEHPTKPGAVSPTEAHSCWLNKIASVPELAEETRHESENLLDWSVASQFVAKQQDRLLTYC